MDTQRMVYATGFHRLPITLTYDPSAADASESWICSVGLDVVTAGATPEEALARAQDEEAMGPSADWEILDA
jgi:hypothetical protein